MDVWAYQYHVQLDFIRPGKPVENSYGWCEPKPSGGSPAMTDSHTTPEAAILVAVDIAKDHNEVLIELRERRDRHRRFRVANTLEE
jgi:hypothetical protein